MSDTADHLEREVEARRASVESTLDALKDRMSVNQVIDDVGQFIGIEDARSALHSAGRQVRENPVALGMIGLGLAWLALSNSGGKDRPRRVDYDGYRGRSGSYEPYSGSSASRDWRDERGQRSGVIDRVVGAVSGAADSVSHAASAAGEKISSTLSGTRDSAGRYADDVSERSGAMRDSAYDRAQHLRESMGERADGLRHRADDLRHRASDMRHAAYDRASHARDSVSATMEQQPLLIGAAAVVLGAVIGAALPRTRTEDRMMGDYRDSLLDEAKVASSELRERAMSAAHQTYDAAVDAARDEGLVPEKGETVVSKLERVADAAVQEAKDQVDPVLHGDAKADANKTEAGKSQAGKSETGKSEAGKSDFGKPVGASGVGSTDASKPKYNV